jgi:hypothetical protein
MARFRLGRAVSIRWNGLVFEGPALTVFEVPDEYNDELQSAMIVEPTFEWVESDEGNTIRSRITALENAGAGAPLSNSNPLALGTAAPGTGTSSSRNDHVHPTTGLALSGHDHSGVYDPAGTAASAVATHVAAADPHSIYLTDAEGDAQYSQLAHTHAIGEASFTTVVKQYVKNDATPKVKGDAVYISGASGTNPIVTYSDADTEPTSSKTLGLLEQDLAANAFGYVITEGKLTNINTAAATDGQTVWLSGTPGGRVYGSPPAEPAHSVYLGVVTKANASTGEIFVKVQNGYELNELHDVSVGSPSNGDIIQWNSTSEMWEKESLATAGIAASSHLHTGVYANATHGHAQADVTNLTTDLAGKAATVHTHATSDITSGNFVATVQAGTGVTSSAPNGNAANTTISIGQAVGTTSNVTFNQVTASDYIRLSAWNHASASNDGSGNGVTVTTANTYYAIGGSSCEISFTPDFVGQEFLITMTGYASLNTAVVQYAFVRVDVTDSSNTQIAVLGYGRADNFGTLNRGGTVALTKTWIADSTSTRKIKLYGTAQTTNGLTLTLSYWQLNAMALA